jgi:hypothetical protein
MRTGFHAIRNALLPALVALSLATSAYAFPDSYRLYSIEGYLDRAPDDATVIDQVEIGATGEPRRQLFVTAYRSPGDVLLDRYLSHELSPYRVWGPRREVARLLRASNGTAIKGTFVVYTHASPSLLITQLDQPN